MGISIHELEPGITERFIQTGQRGVGVIGMPDPAMNQGNHGLQNMINIKQ